ncbi:cytochrome C class I [Fictibacillus macauensis ZFHKF-1]|uniref:Cytochrome C class I n=1 Tax=Fictibacillus macauensis ZFHKF-1 TaxID=1196324 RepID=I8AMS4_9BACL|nr:cytochrome c [Fictibacillus macauensis]EIT86984.1 cytochrome C class I [Fictibacillus macauensis ZFHKF-1]
MKKRLLIASLALLTLGACSNDDQATKNKHNKQNTEAADSLYKQNCARCHGVDLQGNIGPSLQKIGSKYSAKEIKGIIENGRNGMPGGILTGGDAKLLGEWLQKNYK